MQEVDCPPQDGPAMPEHLAGVVEVTDQGLQVFSGISLAVSPLLQELQEALEFVCWEAELLCDCVNLYAQEGQARGGTVSLVGCQWDLTV